MNFMMVVKGEEGNMPRSSLYNTFCGGVARHPDVMRVSQRHDDGVTWSLESIVFVTPMTLSFAQHDGGRTSPGADRT